MELHIFIASGETCLMDNIKKVFNEENTIEKFNIIMVPLKVGDILIGISDGVSKYNSGELNELLGEVYNNIFPVILIERKSYSDFCNSYSNEHLKNQFIRMDAFEISNNCRSLLIIEKNINIPISNNNKYLFSDDTFEQCCSSILVRDKKSIYIVNSIEHHAKFIFKICKSILKYHKIKKNENIRQDNKTEQDNVYLSNNDCLFNNIDQNAYIRTIKVNKKQNINANVYYQTIIASIPMFSIEIADIITKHYSKLTELINELNLNGIKNIKDIKIGKNKLGNIKANRLRDFLLGIIN